jgi:hypothetical protein
MFISSVFIYLEYLNYILNIPYVSKYQYFWLVTVSPYLHAVSVICRLRISSKKPQVLLQVFDT